MACPILSSFRFAKDPEYPYHEDDPEDEPQDLTLTIESGGVSIEIRSLALSDMEKINRICRDGVGRWSLGGMETEAFMEAVGGMFEIWVHTDHTMVIRGALPSRKNE
jgi:hypothetical protein